MRRSVLAAALMMLSSLGPIVPAEAGEPVPVTKRCVGNPPRQTEDPMSAPCVAFFDDDNHGHTYPGVTPDEIRLLLYFDAGAYQGEVSPADGTYVDLDAPPQAPCPATWPVVPPDRDECDHVLIRSAQALTRSLTNRYQTYGRRPHFYAYFSDARSAAGRRADAVENYERIEPFAVLDQALFNGFNRDYDEAMTTRGAMVFASPSVLTRAQGLDSAPHEWSFLPDIEHRAALYASYVCVKVAPFPVSHAGNPQGVSMYNGRPRKFGLFSTTDPARPDLVLFAGLVKDHLRACGVNASAEAVFPESGYVVDASDPGLDQLQAVARFQSSEVTTVLWLGGVEGKFSQWADAVKYYPEIVVAGDLGLDEAATARLQNQNVWHNAWGPTSRIRIDYIQESFGYVAARDGGATPADARLAAAVYRDHFIAYEALQAAGPGLTPGAVKQAFHGRPSTQSFNPYVAACFFDPDDYSCVKDAMQVWWDPSGHVSGSMFPGCYRMVQQGRRFLAGRWALGDDAFRNPADPCFGDPGSRSIRVL